MIPAQKERVAHLILRIGLAFAFVYPPYAALSDPFSWISYFPGFVRNVPISTAVLLHGFGAFETLLALWILSGWRVRYAAICAALILFAIVAFNVADFEVLFRDLSIAAIALALTFWPKPHAF